MHLAVLYSSVIQLGAGLMSCLVFTGASISRRPDKPDMYCSCNKSMSSDGELTNGIVRRSLLNLSIFFIFINNHQIAVSFIVNSTVKQFIPSTKLCFVLYFANA